MTQKELDTYYIKVAQLCAENSKAKRLHAGSVLVKNQQIISDGFNGTPKGFENECEYVVKYKDECGCCSHGTICEWGDDCKPCDNCKGKRDRLKTKDYVLHSESNCLTKAMRCGSSTDKATMYVTHAPCVNCSKLIIQGGIERVVYLNDYANTDGIKLLRRAKIKVEKYEN